MQMNDLINRIELLKDKTESEENLKIHVTKWMLEQLGFDESSFDFEHSLCRRKRNDMHADIFIPLDGGKAFFVETKKYTKDLDEDDVLQLAEYITLHSNEITWGLLTNGRQNFLFNSGIDISGNSNKTLLDKCVFIIEYNPTNGRVRNEAYFKYFTKENIFDRQVTLYFKAVNQFFAKHELTNQSKEKYINTLYQFFDYYISEGAGYNYYGAREYAPLEEIQERDFIRFLKNFKSGTRQSSGAAPLAKCSHITKMYEVLKTNGYIANNPMENLRKRALCEFKTNATVVDPKTILSVDSINIIVSRLSGKNYKMIIFVLAAYYGLNRDKITSFLSLKWEAVDFIKHTFVLEEKKYPMVKLLEESLKAIKNEYKQKDIKKPIAIYFTKKNGVFKTVGTDSVNAVFAEIQKYNDGGVEWKLFNPQNTRGSAIYNMLCSGCSIEEISYLTDAPLQQLIQYMPDEIVRSNGEKKWKAKNSSKDKHPFKNIFD